MSVEEKSQHTLEVLKNHQSIRKFTGAKITPEQMQQIYAAIAQSSSSCFLQLVTTIAVQDQSKLEQIAHLAGEQQHIAQCSHFLVFCLDVTKLELVAGIKPPYGFNFIMTGLNDCTVACQNAFVAAEAQGLGGVIVGGFRRNIAAVSELLKLPQGVVPLLALCLGVPDPEYIEEQKPRLPQSWLFMDEEYHDPFNAEELAQYDEKMRQYYKGRRYNQQDATWTDSVKVMLIGMKCDAAGIIAYLKKQGFEFF